MADYGHGRAFLRTVVPDGFSVRKKLPLHTVLDLLPDGTLRETERILTFPFGLLPLGGTRNRMPRRRYGTPYHARRLSVSGFLYGRGGRFRPFIPCRHCFGPALPGNPQKRKEGRLRLVSLKPERYDDIVLPKERIRALYRICGTFRYWDG